MFPTVAILFYIPISNVQRFQLLHILAKTILIIAIWVWSVISYGFDFHFPND